MENNSIITVEVCYIAPQIQFLRKVDLANGCTILQAIVASDLLLEVSDLVLEEVRVGVFSKLKQLDTKLKHADRVEIYRPLQVDPMLARRARANKNLKKN